MWRRRGGEGGEKKQELGRMRKRCRNRRRSREKEEEAVKQSRK